MRFFTSVILQKVFLAFFFVLFLSGVAQARDYSAYPLLLERENPELWGGDPIEHLIFVQNAEELKTALESSLPYWIRFASSGIYEFNEEVFVKGSKTLDGRGLDVRLKGSFNFEESRQIILSDLAFLSKEETSSEALLSFFCKTQGDKERLIWIQHVQLLQNSSSKPALKVKGRCKMTLSWSEIQAEWPFFVEEPGDGSEITLHHNELHFDAYKNLYFREYPARLWNNYIRKKSKEALWNPTSFRKKEKMGTNVELLHNLFEKGFLSLGSQVKVSEPSLLNPRLLRKDWPHLELSFGNLLEKIRLSVGPRIDSSAAPSSRLDPLWGNVIQAFFREGPFNSVQYDRETLRAQSYAELQKRLSEKTGSAVDYVLSEEEYDSIREKGFLLRTKDLNFKKPQKKSDSSLCFNIEEVKDLRFSRLDKSQAQFCHLKCSVFGARINNREKRLAYFVNRFLSLAFEEKEQEDLKLCKGQGEDALDNNSYLRVTGLEAFYQFQNCYCVMTAEQLNIDFMISM